MSRLPLCVTSALLVTGAALTVIAPGIAAESRHADATTVAVTFMSNRFSISRPGAPAGPITFLATNRGPKLRVLKIVGPGVTGTRTLSVPAGKRATLTITATKGAYMLLDSLAKPPSAHWLVVAPAANVSATGNGSVVTPITVTTGMNCD